MENNRRAAPKFTCYFCNNTIENETEMGHTSVCSRVLLPCPNNCGSYIERMALQKHNKECVNRTINSKARQQVPVRKLSEQPSLQQLPMKAKTNVNYNSPQVLNTMMSASLPSSTNRKIKNEIDEELYKLSRRLADLESRFEVYRKNQSQPIPFQYFDKLKTAQLQLTLDLEKLKYQTQLAYDWRLKTDTFLDTLKLNISSIENSRRQYDSDMVGLKNKISLLDNLQEQINHLKDSFLREQAYNRQVDMNFNDNIEEIKRLQAQDAVKSVAILSDVKDSLDVVKIELADLSNKVDDQGIKFTNIIYDLRGVNQTAADAIKKYEDLEKSLEDLSKNMVQMRLDMEILEDLSGCNDFRHEPGRLLWKITDVNTKMDQAKQSGAVIKSPIFFTHEYGYRIRILLYMNGLKKWKDRYALLCLHVLKGDYDMTLKWPCHIEGNISLKDLEDLEKGKPFTKLISAKRQEGNEECEEPQESSSCYIFIPHTTLLKSNYVKKDILFLEFKIRQNGKLETSL